MQKMLRLGWITALVVVNVVLARDLLAQCDATCTPSPGSACRWTCMSASNTWAQGCGPTDPGANCGSTECGLRPAGGCNEE